MTTADSPHDITDLRALQRCADGEIRGLAWPTIWLSTAAIAGFIAATGLAAAEALPLWVAGLVNIVCFFIAYTGLHEATHRNFHGRNKSFRWLNNVYGFIIGAMMFYPYSMHDYIHLRHHAHTNDPEKDLDHWMSGASASAVAGRAIRLPWHYWSTMVVTKLNDPDRTRYFRRIALEFAPTVIGISLLNAAGQWKVALFVWFGALLVAVAILGVCFDWITHHPHQRQTLMGATRVFVARSGWRRKALNIALLGQNFHLIHHIYPRTPFYRYEQVFQRGEAFLRAEGVTIIDVGK